MGPFGSVATKGIHNRERIRFYSDVPSGLVSLERLPDKRRGANTVYRTVDFGMAAFSAFFTQCPSFLEHQKQLEDGHGRSNCQTLFGNAQDSDPQSNPATHRPPPFRRHTPRARFRVTLVAPSYRFQTRSMAKMRIAARARHAAIAARVRHAPSSLASPGGSHLYPGRTVPAWARQCVYYIMLIPISAHINTVMHGPRGL